MLRLDGTPTQSEEQRQLRWQEHFATVFGGVIMPVAALCQRGPDAMSPPVPDGEPGLVRIGPVRTADAIQRLNLGKGVGRDRIPAEVLCAGGDAMAVAMALYTTGCTMTRSGQLIGRAVTLSMSSNRKASVKSQECDNSRCMLLNDHLAKGLCDIIDDNARDAYNRNVPPRRPHLLPALPDNVAQLHNLIH